MQGGRARFIQPTSFRPRFQSFFKAFWLVRDGRHRHRLSQLIVAGFETIRRAVRIVIEQGRRASGLSGNPLRRGFDPERAPASHVDVFGLIHFTPFLALAPRWARVRHLLDLNCPPASCFQPTSWRSGPTFQSPPVACPQDSKFFA